MTIDRNDTADAARRRNTDDGDKRSDQERFDASYESDARGEHRYDDLHQSTAEQDSRRQRDDLKRRLAGQVAPPDRRPYANAAATINEAERVRHAAAEVRESAEVRLEEQQAVLRQSVRSRS